jgi:hypothetical protein
VWRRACIRIVVPIVEEQQEKKKEVYGHCWGIIVQLKNQVKETTLDHQFCAGSFMKIANSFKIFKNLELGVFLTLNFFKTWNWRFCDSECFKKLESEVLSFQEL